ncbi:MAG: hypothetical protein AAF356_11765 [Planctomycetota bacterium]
MRQAKLCVAGVVLFAGLGAQVAGGVLTPIFRPQTASMTNARLAAESYLLVDAARTLPWWLGWAPALRHEALSEAWARRHPLPPPRPLPTDRPYNF